MILDKLLRDEDSILFIDPTLSNPKDIVSILINRHIIMGNLVNLPAILMDTDNIQEIRDELAKFIKEYLDNLAGLTTPGIAECWVVRITGDQQLTNEQLNISCKKFQASMARGENSPTDIIEGELQRRIVTNLIYNGYEVRDYTVTADEWEINHFCEPDECGELIRHCNKIYRYELSEGHFTIMKIFQRHQFRDFFHIPEIVSYMSKHNLTMFIPNSAFTEVSRCQNIPSGKDN